jgi:putative transposase
MRIHDPKTRQSYFSKRRRRDDDSLAPRCLTFSCYKRYQFLNRDRTRQRFVEELAQARSRWPIDVWAYVIMPEHVHLIVAPRERLKVGRVVGWVKEQVARKAIAWMEKHAPQWLPRITVQEGELIRRRFWQPGGGYDRSIESEAALLAMILYIHQNPVRRGLTTRAEEWLWSSAQWYAGMTDVPLAMDRTLPMMTE